MLLQDYKRLFEENSEIKAIYKNGQIVWPRTASTNPLSEPFYLENTGNAAKTVTILKSNSSAPTLTIEVSSDRLTWSELGQTSDTAPLNISVPAGEKVYMRCNTNRWSSSASNNNIISFDDTVGGNIMSLLYGSSFDGTETTFPGNTTYQFDRLFYNTSITNANKLLLPATTLAASCYQGMFFGCASLTTAPALPATTLANSCYNATFQGCTSLTQAPALPATTLTNQCYRQLFKNCSSLSQAPELPANTLIDYCYYQMFEGCSLLNYIKCLATSGINTNNSTTNWVYIVAAAGTFVKAAGVNWPTGNNGIPSGWTVIEE